MTRAARFTTAFVVVTALCAGGCATIVHGDRQTVQIVSEPPGADVKIDDKDAGKTPVQATLERKMEHKVEVSAPGYEPAHKTLATSIDTPFWGNLVCGGLVGFLVDYGTGSMYRLDPGVVSCELTRAGPALPGDARVAAAKGARSPASTPVTTTTPASTARPALAAVVPAPPKSLARVLVLETRASDKKFVDKVRAYGDLLATLLEQRTGAEIVPSTSVKDRLSLANDKLDAGCDDTACMSEIAGALDARYVVTSRASQIGGRWSMRVELFDSQDLKVIASKTMLADNIEALAAQAEVVADALVTQAPVLRR